MKCSLLILILSATALLSACGNDKIIDGKHYETFGLANQEAHQDPSISYEISAGSVIWGIILCETVVVPIYVIGWDLYQPVKKKTDIPK